MSDSEPTTNEPRVVTAEVGGLVFRWDLDASLLTVGGFPAVSFFRDSSLAHLMQGFHRMVGSRRFSLALRAEGMRSVDDDWAVVSAAPSFEEGFVELAKYAGTAGWGRWELIALDRDAKQALFRIHGGWESGWQRAVGVSYGTGFVAGKLIGLCQRLFGVTCGARHTMSAADGDPYDELVVEPAERSVDDELLELASADQATAADLQHLLAEVRASAAAREAALAERDRMVAELQEKMALIAEQRQAIMALSTPIIELWEEVLAVPIIGAVDAARTLQVMERLLEAILQRRARFAILDVTGVETIDTATADNFVRIIRAVQLLGARGVIAGIGPQVAQTIVDLGVDLTGIPTYSNLREALQAFISAPRARRQGSGGPISQVKERSR
ncbi:MAG TPA: STAS domain-containing protein [Nannocystis sp.]